MGIDHNQNKRLRLRKIQTILQQQVKLMRWSSSSPIKKTRRLFHVQQQSNWFDWSVKRSISVLILYVYACVVSKHSQTYALIDNENTEGGRRRSETAKKKNEINSNFSPRPRPLETVHLGFVLLLFLRRSLCDIVATTRYLKCQLSYK